MILQRLFVARPVDVLQDLDDDGRVAVGVEVDFLVVGDFADLAAVELVGILGGMGMGLGLGYWGVAQGWESVLGRTLCRRSWRAGQWLLRRRKDQWL
jgi:hypothetical protein